MSNKKDELDELLNDDYEDDLDGPTKIDMVEISKNIPQYSSQRLCEMIVCDRYFGLEQNISVICMEELAKRRINGDTFNFEEHIEAIKKELPILDFSLPDIRTVLNRAIAGKKK